MKNVMLLYWGSLLGCINNTKLENNTHLDSGDLAENQTIDEPAHTDTNTLFSIDTTFGQISQIDPTDGSTISIGSISTDYEISSMALNQDGVAYIYDHFNHKIGLFDPCSGELDLRPIANEEYVICGISFMPNGSLYGIDSKNNLLVQYNLETGEAISIGSLNMNIRACGLAYDSTSGQLVGATGSTGEIFNIDINTGDTLNHLSTDVPFESVGVEYDQSTDTLIVSTGNTLYSVDLMDGTATQLGVMEGHVDDLIFHEKCQ